MNGNHPKRRKDKYNPYNIFEKEGRYFLSFRDGEGAEYTQEIDQCLYNQFNRFELDDLSQLNEWDRHIEHGIYVVWPAYITKDALFLIGKTKAFIRTRLCRLHGCGYITYFLR